MSFGIFCKVKGDADLSEPSPLRALGAGINEWPELLPLGHSLSAMTAAASPLTLATYKSSIVSWT